MAGIEPTMIELRPDQMKVVQEIRDAFRDGVKSLLLTAPTAWGKTVVFCYMGKATRDRGKRVAILVHRAELLDQVSKTLTRFGVDHSRVESGTAVSQHPVIVASVQTLARRVEKYEIPDLVIVDEAHHAISGSMWNTVLEAWSSAYRLGVTATPERLSGEGLRDTFSEMILGPTTRALISEGILSDYKIYAPPAQIEIDGLRKFAGDYEKVGLHRRATQITGHVVDHYRTLVDGKRAIAFCISVSHAHEVAQAFKTEGIEAASIDGKMERTLRSEIIQDFRDGRIKVLTSCEIVSEGFDLPAIEAAILLRPTASLALYRQQVGRALRAHPGKTAAVILDHAGNSLRHGMPDDDIDWSLDGFVARNRTANTEIATRQCKACFAVYRASLRRCPYCQQEVVPEPSEVEIIDATLVEIERQSGIRMRRVEQGRARSMPELIALGRARGYANPAAWAWHVSRSRGR